MFNRKVNLVNLKIKLTKLSKIEHRFGTITGKYVIYLGENDMVNGISYVNVEKYLKGFR